MVGTISGDSASASLAASAAGRYSLTVNEVRDADDGTHLAVNIIPHTAAHTTLGSLAAGSAVNVEIDVISRYLQRMTAAKM